MKFLVEVADDAVPTDLVEDCLENDLSCHVVANQVVELPAVQDPYQYLYAEVEHATMLLRAAYPYLESMIGVASSMRSLLPDVEEFLNHHPCDYDPMTMKDAPIGMYHCPKCGEMVIAGLPHPKYEEQHD